MDGKTFYLMNEGGVDVSFDKTTVYYIYHLGVIRVNIFYTLVYIRIVVLFCTLITTLPLLTMTQ